MDFEEMKVIWDTQNEEPLYAFDEAALHQSVRKKARGFKRLVVFFEAVMMVVALGGSVLYVIEPLRDGQDYHRFVSAAIFLAAATHFFIGIRRRWQRETGFDQSLLRDLNKALWQVDYHISRSRAIRWWFIFPCVLGISIDFVFRLDFRLVWIWLLFLLLMAVATWGIEKEIRCLYLPKKRRLEALRDKLVATER